MAVVRRIEIKNFRSIHSFDWRPTEGFNCIVGSGDAGKSSVLDAIDFCLCARRTLPISDADFYRLDVDKDISITLTLGRLDDDLKNYEKYGDFIRGLSGAGELVDSSLGVGSFSNTSRTRAPRIPSRRAANASLS